jgi:splicing factor 3B subunit 1
LLNNLKVQERQNRVCTTIAIAIVAETCQPFTVLPAVMNEYRVPEMNVQNGVLKTLSFLFEYIGEMAKDYIYAVVPLLEDALMDRDLVHRQTACATVKHMALGRCCCLLWLLLVFLQTGRQADRQTGRQAVVAMALLAVQVHLSSLPLPVCCPRLWLYPWLCFAGVVGLSCEEPLSHLMNFVWPNIFETSPHVIEGCLGAIEALRYALGPQRVLNYVLQGLFHPARRVRERYWVLWNNCYIYSADALTACYPRVPSDATNRYERTYTTLFL